jgi:hypothetical protein
MTPAPPPPKSFVRRVADLSGRVLCTLAVVAFGWIVAVSFRGSPPPPADAWPDSDPRELREWDPASAVDSANGNWEFSESTAIVLLPRPTGTASLARLTNDGQTSAEIVRVPDAKTTWPPVLKTAGWRVTETAAGWTCQRDAETVRIAALPDEPDGFLVTLAPRSDRP